MWEFKRSSDIGSPRPCQGLRTGSIPVGRSKFIVLCQYKFFMSGCSSVIWQRSRFGSEWIIPLEVQFLPSRPYREIGKSGRSRCFRKAKISGSNPLFSTILFTRCWWNGRHTALRTQRPCGMGVQISRGGPIFDVWWNWQTQRI